VWGRLCIHGLEGSGWGEFWGEWGGGGTNVTVLGENCVSWVGSVGRRGGGVHFILHREGKKLFSGGEKRNVFSSGGGSLPEDEELPGRKDKP